MSYRILFVHGSSQNIGGQEIALLNTIKSLRNLGVTSDVVLPKEGRFGYLLKEKQIPTHNLEFNRLLKTNPIPFLKSVYFLFKLIKKLKISILHCSGAYPTQFCLPAAKISGRPCVSHIHSTIYSKQEIRNSFVPQADYILAVSDAVKDMLITYGCSPSKTETVYCGVIDSQIKANCSDVISLKKRYDIAPQDKIIGQISLISPIKGLDIFIEMAKKVKNLIPNTKFFIIGNANYGYEDYEKQLLQSVRDANLSDTIIFTGFQKEIYRFIAMLDVSVLSSRIEGLPLSVIESMSLGKPVVATSVGGIPEVIKNGKTGILVPPDDCNALTEAVIDLLANKQKAEQLGRDGKEFVYEKFSLNNHGKQIIKIYDNLLKRN